MVIRETNNHPECQEGEIFLKDIVTAGSMLLKEFEMIKKDWNSARLGLHSYNNVGYRVAGKRPVFVSFEEKVSRTPVSP